MEERKNYVVYVEGGRFDDDEEHVVNITKEQARAIEWFMKKFDIDGCVELAEKYEGEEI